MKYKIKPLHYSNPSTEEVEIVEELKDGGVLVKEVKEKFSQTFLVHKDDLEPIK